MLKIKQHDTVMRIQKKVRKITRLHFMSRISKMHVRKHNRMIAYNLCRYVFYRTMHTCTFLKKFLVCCKDDDA